MSAWSDIDLTDVVEQVAAATWDQRNGEHFGAWSLQVPATKHHIRESMLPTVLIARDALAGAVAAMERAAAARALRQVADDLASITAGPTGKAIEHWPAGDQNIYELAIEEASAKIHERADEVEVLP